MPLAPNRKGKLISQWRRPSAVLEFTLALAEFKGTFKDMPEGPGFAIRRHELRGAEQYSLVALRDFEFEEFKIKEGDYIIGINGTSMVAVKVALATAKAELAWQRATAGPGIHDAKAIKQYQNNIDKSAQAVNEVMLAAAKEAEQAGPSLTKKQRREAQAALKKRQQPLPSHQPLARDQLNPMAVEPEEIKIRIYRRSLAVKPSEPQLDLCSLRLTQTQARIMAASAKAQNKRYELGLHLWPDSVYAKRRHELSQLQGQPTTPKYVELAAALKAQDAKRNSEKAKKEFKELPELSKPANTGDGAGRIAARRAQSTALDMKTSYAQNTAGVFFAVELNPDRLKIAREQALTKTSEVSQCVDAVTRFAFLSETSGQQQPDVPSNFEPPDPSAYCGTCPPPCVVRQPDGTLAHDAEKRAAAMQAAVDAAAAIDAAAVSAAAAALAAAVSAAAATAAAAAATAADTALPFGAAAEPDAQRRRVAQPPGSFQVDEDQPDVDPVLPPTWTTMPRAARIRAAQRGTRWRPPVIYFGDWVLNRKQTSGAFPKKRFLRELAKRAIVIVCHEYYTTKLCGDCGCEMKFPYKSGAKAHQKFRGTVYCPNKTCASRGQFQNRDVAAACNIVNRFMYGFFVGELGCFSKTANADSPRISLSGALNPPRPPTGVASSA